jgi:hypothetical protein
MKPDDLQADPGWTLARRADRMNPSVIREILKVTERPGIISFAGGLPSPQTFPVDAFAEACAKVLRDDGRAALQYAASEGYGPLREAVAAMLPWAVDPASVLPGKVRMLYVRDSGAPRTVVMQAELAARGVGPNAQPVFLTAQHDNEWFYGNGVDLLFEPGVDANLRAAVSIALIENDQPSPHRVMLRPKADGIVDFEQKNFSDWEMFASTLCSSLKSAGASVNCLPQP